MSVISKASLVLIPSGYGEDVLYSEVPNTTAGDFTFTRASTGTRVNADGYIEEVPWNMLQYSEDYTQWTKSANTTLVGSQTSPINTSTAYALQHSGTTAEYWILKTNVALPSANVTMSAYLKKGTKKWVVFRVGNLCLQYFDIENEVLGNNIFGSPISYNFVDAGNDWVRLDMTVLGNGGNNGIQIYSTESGSSGQVTGTSGDLLLYVWGVQVVKGNSPKPYIKTTDRLDIPRLDYSGGASCPTLLLEPQRTNLVTYSEDYSDSSWTKVNASVSSNTTTSPSGETNASTLVSTSGTSEQYLDVGSLSVTSGEDYTMSVFVKKNNYDFFLIRFSGAGGAFTAGNVFFDINNGTLGTVDSGYTGSIESFANGWYRCSATKTASGTTASGKVRLQLATSDNTESITGDGSSGTFIYGSQFEQGSFPTSYIPTSGTSVTRVKDATQSLVIDDMTGSSEFTWFFDNTGMNVLTSVAIYMQILCSGGALRYYATNGGRFRGSSYFGEINAIGKLAVKSDGTTLTMFMNGVKSTSTLTQSIGTFTSFSGLNISGETFSGGLHNMQFYNTALTDTELEELTTI